MSSTNVYYCDFCKKRVKEYIDGCYGKVSKETYEKIKSAETIKELLPLLSDNFFVSEKVSRIDNLDYEFFEDWGDGISINEDGNLEISISGSCDFCGKEFNYEIILPETSSTKKINLVKQKGDKK